MMHHLGPGTSYNELKYQWLQATAKPLIFGQKYSHAGKLGNTAHFRLTCEHRSLTGLLAVFHSQTNGKRWCYREMAWAGNG